MTHSANWHEKARRIRLLALDVDGVLTDGTLHFHSDGQETKSFNILDGLGIKLLQQGGVDVALITGRESPMVSRRAEALGIAHVLQGREDKLVALNALCEQLALPLASVAYCGDDLPDLAAIRAAGLGLSVSNAPAYVREYADWIPSRPGGQGAVRDICDALLTCQGRWDASLAPYLDDLE
ncbi:3-deoxy-D-manno-octulosonate 8-phosphate phosphatase (KDO 8-P phosphatase) [Chromohalobacter marismortui]|uniref:3-deoxy-D-manno-octulosonate 8-phosphate phosphatase KdsC n=1 Tax=Chromohalobacter marismortui TaxID=42055 RepID=A0A4R7NQ34_9GAMM|nr:MULTISPECIES: HAD hydrolase family protein [Chromohalobacter]MCI0508555.1 HAD hydrolase family protein [Chromohalobacter sp.]MCI0592510.1 HAD hydrolase family protein [Chromohalobacter sp.]TDU23035.1 3-deoxy-D-manno-octulosonate 8-phosphate phosphatase (KDO 8-P phosphatase) [Chromohalobacter marismortui]